MARAGFGGFASRTTMRIVSCIGEEPIGFMEETFTTEAGRPLLIVEDVLIVGGGAAGAVPPFGTRYRTFLF